MHKRDLIINHNRVIEFSKYNEYVAHTTILIQMLDIELYSSPTCKPKKRQLIVVLFSYFIVPLLMQNKMLTLHQKNDLNVQQQYTAY